ncbi:MAG TPA: phospholipase D-like domain-containing protein [Flavipsychrobacter sp.]
MNFISNISATHKGPLIKLIADADEVCIAVAFLKQSGLKSQLPAFIKAIASGTSIQVVAGRHYALTEPAALTDLYKLFQGKANSRLRLANYAGKDPVFHPKLYLFRKGTKCTIISGSANMTRGGLEDNIECSVMLECNTNDQIWQDGYAFFAELMSDKRSEKGDDAAIGEYAKFYHLQKKRNRSVKPVPDELEYDRKEAYRLLRHYYNLHEEEEGRNNVSSYMAVKNNSYVHSKRLLNNIANAQGLTKQTFIPMLESLISGRDPGRWYSHGLQRKKKKIFNDYRQFQRLVHYVKHNHHKPINEVFSDGMSMVRNVNGAGANYLGEILMTYDPARYANLNNTLVKALNDICGIEVNKNPQSYTADEYVAYCSLWQEIKREFRLNNLLEVDYVLYNAYKMYN